MALRTARRKPGETRGGTVPPGAVVVFPAPGIGVQGFPLAAVLVPCVKNALLNLVMNSALCGAMDADKDLYCVG
eukprot:15464572-Alexandrium_andersonii.AAC.1